MENIYFRILVALLLVCYCTIIISASTLEGKGENLLLQYDKDGDGKLDIEELSRIYESNQALQLDDEDDSHKSNQHPPSEMEKWMYGTVSALGISVLSLLGVVLFPIRSNTKEKIMSLLLVGTMLSTVFYDLLPTIYGVHSHLSDKPHPAGKITYMLRTTVILASMVFFFIFERQLMISVHGLHNHNGTTPHDHHHHHNDEDEENGIDEVHKSLLHPNTIPSPSHDHNEQTPKLPAHYAHAIRHPQPVEITEKWWTNIQPYHSIASFLNYYTIHNFVDGVAIGASYSISFTTGIAVTVAMLVHEIPEGLGDFVILIRAGMSRKLAIMCNLLSALMRLIGVLSGLLIARISINATQWMLCFSVGGFLYITLTNMVHELYHEGGRWHILFQAGSILLGYSVLFVYIMWGE